MKQQVPWIPQHEEQRFHRSNWFQPFLRLFVISAKGAA
ncbi:hypothetical protein J3R75_002742 [Oligosphaera ethanolica]|uniref:Uncharacterized protein n=1 Tax=Oligosphaera ethanolica TaxID=760260 RepID=A0AAE4APK5_9BACT|nr:hypothetical protein [Oligosphaera ethanolica]